VKVLNRKLEKLKKVHQNLSEVILVLDKDLFTRHGFHLNIHGKEHVANVIVSELCSLFEERMKFPIALKWNDMDVNDRYLVVNQMTNADVTTECGSIILTKPHSYFNSDSGIQDKSDRCIKLSECNYVLSALNCQACICVKKKALQNGVMGEPTIQQTEEELIKHETMDAPIKRT
jgi:hypothetical protein